MPCTRIGAAVLLALIPLAALAQATAPPSPPAARASPALSEARAKMRAACAADVEKFCAGVERGKGGMRTCLREHRSELSADCTSARQQVRATRAKEKG